MMLPISPLPFDATRRALFSAAARSLMPRHAMIYAPAAAYAVMPLCRHDLQRYADLLLAIFACYASMPQMPCYE